MYGLEKIVTRTRAILVSFLVLLQCSNNGACQISWLTSGVRNIIVKYSLVIFRKLLQNSRFNRITMRLILDTLSNKHVTKLFFIIIETRKKGCYQILSFNYFGMEILWNKLVMLTSCLMDQYENFHKRHFISK